LAAAASIRGSVDYLYYSIEKNLLWIPDMLEILSKFLSDHLGPKWWINTPLERFSPKSKSRNRIDGH
jgi:hypothetical protein